MRVKVQRTWPGGPPRGHVITVAKARADMLLRGGFVVADTEASAPRRRGSPRLPERADRDLLDAMETR